MPQGIDGFLGTRASLMLDVVVLAMVAVIPILVVSIYLVRVHRQYRWHKRLQCVLGILLAIAVTLFEIDIRMHGWRDRAEASPYYDTKWSHGLVNWSLWIHLVFALSATVLWIVVTVRALRRFPSPPAPSAHSGSHIFWARLAAGAMVMTAVTGWIFYYFAFVA